MNEWEEVKKEAFTAVAEARKLRLDATEAMEEVQVMASKIKAQQEYLEAERVGLNERAKHLRYKELRFEKTLNDSNLEKATKDLINAL